MNIRRAAIARETAVQPQIPTIAVTLGRSEATKMKSSMKISKADFIFNSNKGIHQSVVLPTKKDWIDKENDIYNNCPE